jgi:hypothetical protein
VVGNETNRPRASRGHPIGLHHRDSLLGSACRNRELPSQHFVASIAVECSRICSQTTTQCGSEAHSLSMAHVDTKTRVAQCATSQALKLLPSSSLHHRSNRSTNSALVKCGMLGAREAGTLHAEVERHMTTTATSTNSTRPADRLRAALQQAGFNARRVSVRHDHPTLRVRIRDASVC